jgi:hypothetical protein
MRQHTGAAGVQEQGCAVLWNLAFNAASKAAIAGAGGVHLVLTAMECHADAVSMQEQGCMVLRNLAADNAANKAAIVRAGGRDMVSAAKRWHGANLKSADDALRVLQ